MRTKSCPYATEVGMQESTPGTKELPLPPSRQPGLERTTNRADEHLRSRACSPTRVSSRSQRRTRNQNSKVKERRPPRSLFFSHFLGLSGQRASPFARFPTLLCLQSMAPSAPGSRLCCLLHFRTRMVASPARNSYDTSRILANRSRRSYEKRGVAAHGPHAPH